MTTTYFSSDGSYGDATSIVLAKTDNWTSSMWEAIDEVGDDGRADLAEHFMVGWHDYELGYNGHPYCSTCALFPEQLPKEENE
jgi:hypothetical protein